MLKSLRSQGREESSGVFSLAPEKALEKFKGFRFPKDDFYILKVIQSAVAAGAQTIEASCTPMGVALGHDGRPLETDSVPGLLSFLFDSSGSRKVRDLHHLAAGVVGSLAVAPRALSIESWDGQAGYCHRWGAGSWLTEKLSQSPEWAVRFRLARPVGEVVGQWYHLAYSDVFDLLTRSPKVKYREESAIYDRCVYLPLKFRINGRPVQATHFGKPRFPGYVSHQDSSPGETRAPWIYLMKKHQYYIEGAVHKKHHLVEVHYGAAPGERASLAIPPSDATYFETRATVGQRCRAWLAIEADLKPGARITYVDDGVTICQKRYDLGCLGLVGVFSAEHLTKDLTGFGLVEDERYQDHLEWLRAQVGELRESLEAHLDRVPIRHYVSTRLAQ